MTRFEEEVLCSQSIIFREESRWIKVASCHFRDVRQIPADRVNIAARECVLSPFCPLYQSLPQPVSLFCFFNLPLTFIFYILLVGQSEEHNVAKRLLQPAYYLRMHLLVNVFVLYIFTHVCI